MILQKKLEQLNIPEREAAVYVALLQLGLTSVGPVVTKTKLHRMLVYQSLEKLKDMRLASRVMKSGKQHWLAANPSIILDRIKKQEEMAQGVIAELQVLREKSQDELHVEILYGRSGLLETLESAIRSAAKTDKLIRIIGGADDQSFYDLVGDWYPTYLKLLTDLGVSKRLIAPANYSKLFQEHYQQEPGNEYRLMSVGLTSPTFTRITQELVSIEIYGSEPIVILIRNHTVARGYLESFELLWKQAGEQE